MLSIIIVNYHSGKVLKDCLQTVYACKDTLSFEVIVVDNSPGDGVKDVISGVYPTVKWITMNYNAGFARANNAGIAVSTGDAILLLNPDTLIVNNAIEKSYTALLESNFMACGVQLINPDGSPQISGNYVMKGGLNYLMQVPYIGRLIRGLGMAAGVSKSNLPEAKETVTEVDWINGAFLMVKKEAIEKAGMLDEDIFLYHEESEWCSRIKKTGKLCIFGDLHVIHLEGQSANQAFISSTTGYSNLSDRKGYQLMLSMFVRIRKEFGIGWYLFHLLFHTACIPFVSVMAFLDALIHLFNSKLILKNIIGYSANVLRCWSFLLLILKNKKHFYKVL